MKWRTEEGKYSFVAHKLGYTSSDPKFWRREKSQNKVKFCYLER